MSQSVGCYTGWGFEWDCFAATDEVLKSFSEIIKMFLMNVQDQML